MKHAGIISKPNTHTHTPTKLQNETFLYNCWSRHKSLIIVSRSKWFNVFKWKTWWLMQHAGKGRDRQRPNHGEQNLNNDNCRQNFESRHEPNYTRYETSIILLGTDKSIPESQTAKKNVQQVFHSVRAKWKCVSGSDNVHPDDRMY